jgi:glycosyltransferase involved in cell wall biosynthesis
MRVAIDARKIADYGIGTYIRGLLGGLAEIGGEERYVVLAPASAREHIPQQFEHVVLDAPHYSFRELLVVSRAVERARADIFHAPHYVVPFTRVPTVVTIHDLIHLHQKLENRLAPLYARVMIARAVRKSAHVLTVTQAVRGQIVRELKCDEQKVSVTPNGVDVIFQRAEPSRSPARYFLFVGNDKPHKNVDRLVEAHVLLRTTIPDASLVLVGARFRRFGTFEGVITPGFVSNSELASLYRNALALVQPSLEEGFGLPALEAMSSGTAVITSRDPALLEITGEAALHVDAESPNEIAAAMRHIACDDDLRFASATRGIERARRFTWGECARETRRVYREALQSAAAPTSPLA